MRIWSRIWSRPFVQTRLLESDGNCLANNEQSMSLFQVVKFYFFFLFTFLERCSSSSQLTDVNAILSLNRMINSHRCRFVYFCGCPGTHNAELGTPPPPRCSGHPQPKLVVASLLRFFERIVFSNYRTSECVVKKSTRNLFCFAYTRQQHLVANVAFVPRQWVSGSGHPGVLL